MYKNNFELKIWSICIVSNRELKDNTEVEKTRESLNHQALAQQHSQKKKASETHPRITTTKRVSQMFRNDALDLERRNPQMFYSKQTLYVYKIKTEKQMEDLFGIILLPK